MSVWTNAIYRDSTFHDVAKHLSSETLQSEFVLSLLDHDIDNEPGLKAPFNLRPGNIRKQIDDGEVNIDDLVGHRPLDKDLDEDWDEDFEGTFRKADEQQTLQLKDREIEETKRKMFRNADNNSRRIRIPERIPIHKPRLEDDLFANLIKKLPATRYGLAGVYHFVARQYRRMGTFYRGRLSPAYAEGLRSAIEGGLAGSYFSPGPARNYASDYVKDLESIIDPDQHFVRDLIRAAVYSGSRPAKRAREDAQQTSEEFPENPRSASIPFHVCYSAYNLLILQAEENEEELTYCFTDLDIERIKRIWNGISNYRIYLRNYGLGEPGNQQRVPQF